MKKSKKIITFLIFMLVIIVANQSFAIGFATSIGTIDFMTESDENGNNNMINTEELVNTSKNYYLGLRIFTK